MENQYKNTFCKHHRSANTNNDQQIHIKNNKYQQISTTNLNKYQQLSTDIEDKMLNIYSNH